MPEERLVSSNELAYVIRDKYPVTDLHTLVIPKRHVASYFNLGGPELNACNELLADERQRITATDSKVEGFNIGINDGAVAGQTIAHCQIHLIPRRKGDVIDARGGVRHLIPGKGFYHSDLKIHL